MASYQATILGDAPTAYYRLDDTSGTLALDISGNGNHATYSGATLGAAGLLTGDSDTAVTFSASGGLTLPPELQPWTWANASLEFWTNVGGTTHYVVYILTPSSQSCYVDNVLTTPVPGSTVLIGEGFDLVGSLATGGVLDEVAIYGYPLSAGQRAAHLAVGTQTTQVNPPAPAPGLRITLAGQDITSTVDEMSIQIKDQMGQSQGMASGGSSSNRAATAQFVTTLGPAALAFGAGQHITFPVLVRMGELIIYDALGNKIYGGFVGKLTDQSEKKSIYTLVESYDYWAHLARKQVQQIYSGVSDVFMIRDLLHKYTPWVDLSLLPSTGTYNFTAKNFKSITLQQALGQISDVTGYAMWISPDRKFHYQFPTNGVTTPFSLSDSPNYVNSFAYAWDSSAAYVVDDTAMINRGVFYGGKQPAPAFTQDLSTQANGSNRLFVLAYYPRSLANGTITVVSTNLNSGNPLTMGYLLGKGTQNLFVSQGGTANILLNADGHTLYFDPGAAAPVNSGANSVYASYRYEFPMNIEIANPTSVAFFGDYYDGVVSDQTVFDSNTAVGRLRTMLDEQDEGLTTIKVSCWKGGIQSGMLLPVKSAVRGVNSTFQVQEVDTVPLGAGNFRYDITAGAWNWNLIDAVMASTQAAFNAGINVNDNSNGQATNAVEIEQILETMPISESYSTQTRTRGGYYARTTALGDGHDAYPGLFSVSS